MVLASTQQQWKDTLSINARLLAEQQQQLELQRPTRATRVITLTSPLRSLIQQWSGCKMLCTCSSEQHVLLSWVCQVCGSLSTHGPQGRSPICFEHGLLLASRVADLAGVPA